MGLVHATPCMERFLSTFHRSTEQNAGITSCIFEASWCARRIVAAWCHTSLESKRHESRRRVKQRQHRVCGEESG